MTAGRILGWYKKISGREWDVPGLIVTKPVNDRRTTAMDHLNYHLLKKESRYDDYVARELLKIARKIAGGRKDRTFQGKSRYR